MKTKRFTKFSRSIILKSILLLTASMLVIVVGGTYYFMNRQMQMNLGSTFEANKVQLQQMSTSLHNEMQQFGNQLTLLAKTSEIKSMDPTIAAGYLKSYNISPLFISGEKISLFDRKDSLICDNDMVTHPAQALHFGLVPRFRQHAAQARVRYGRLRCGEGERKPCREFLGAAPLENPCR